MGIKDIKTLLTNQSIDTKISNFKDKRVLVDASIYLYRFTYRAPTQEDSTRYVVDGFLQQLKIFKKYNIIPVYVFDGVATQHKKVLEERAERRKKVANRAETTRKEVTEMELMLMELEDRYDNNNNTIEKEDKEELEKDEHEKDEQPIISLDIKETPQDNDTKKTDEMKEQEKNNEEQEKNKEEKDEEQTKEQQTKEQPNTMTMEEIDQIKITLYEKRESIVRMEKQIRKPTSENIRSTIKLFKLLNVPHIVSPVESDALCAYLTQNKKVDVVFTEDTDMIPLRCPSFVSGFDRERAVLTEFKVDKILEGLDITYEQLVDVCILCGCDYADKISQIGPKRALPLIKKYGTIENIIEKYIKPNEKLIEKHTYAETFLSQVSQARIMFYTAHNINDYLITHDIVAQTSEFKWEIPTGIHSEFVTLLTNIGMTKDAHIRWLRSFDLI